MIVQRNASYNVCAVISDQSRIGVIDQNAAILMDAMRFLLLFFAIKEDALKDSAHLKSKKSIFRGKAGSPHRAQATSRRI